MLSLDNSPLPVLLIAFCAAMLLFSIAINGLLLKFSFNLGTKNEGGQVRWAATTKPAFGGISFFIIFLIAIIFVSIFIGGNQMLLNTKFLGVFSAVSLGFMMGLADDAYNTKPFLKFIVQFLCALILVFSGNSIQVFQYEALNYFTTMLWVIGLMNSINMLDNMDGITASVSAVICSGAVFMMLYKGDTSNLYLLLIMGIISGLLGFLYFNWNPSRMYMGDSGSQFLGTFLAVVGIEYFWNAPDNHGNIIPAKQIIIAISMFIIPIADTTTVSINRLLKGKSPFVGGRDHTTHHLSYLGLSDRQVAITMIAISVLTMSYCVFIVNNLLYWDWTYTLTFGALFLIILLGLYSTTKLSSKNK
jgi:UDP-GlcNAc:undecaprenyl-phosphate GlcNAc-1-phosphate transferase